MHGGLPDLGVLVTQSFHQQLHLQATIHRSRQVGVSALQSLLADVGQLLAEGLQALGIRLLRHDIQQLLSQVSDIAIVSGHRCRAGQLGKLRDFLLDHRVLLLAHVGHVHARHTRALGSHHLSKNGHDGLIALAQLVVGNHHEEHLLQGVLSFVDEVQQQLVIRLLVLNGGRKQPLVRQVLLKYTSHILGRRFAVCKARKHLLHQLGPTRLHAEAVQQCHEVLLGRGYVSLNGGCQGEDPLKGRDLFHLGRVLELKFGEQLACGHDASRAQSVGDLAGLTGLQGHNHLHSFELNESLTLVHLGTFVVQVAHHLAIHIGAQLRRIVNIRDHDGLAADDQAKSQRFLLALYLLAEAARAHVKGPIRLLAHLGLQGLAVDAQDVDVGSCPRDMEGELLITESDLHREAYKGVGVCFAQQNELTLLH
mmetsp:Transcript_13622/g.32498  ORF Transcript_13622/g.32498 Transcript_13622/m.32498 type:complete len:423 (+) Transcript_13622:1227-2495(+)